MLRASALAKLEAIFGKQLAFRRYEVTIARRSTIKRDEEILMTYAIVNILNNWSQFIRAFYFSCVFGTYRRSSLRVQSPTVFANMEAALGFAIQAFRPHATPNVFGQWHRRDEPPWHDPNTLMQLAQLLAFQNQADIATAFSLQLRVFADLPIIRNFYAHRNLGTQTAAQAVALNYGIPTFHRATQMVLSNPVLRPQPLIFEWIDELRITADFLCA